jgi:formylglycine-generating enzyme required for sulfatase activity
VPASREIAAAVSLAVAAVVTPGPADRAAPANLPEPPPGASFVAAGEFVPGRGEAPEASPDRRMHVPAFWIGTTEVTAGAFRDCVQGGQCSPANFRTSRDHASCNYLDPQREGHPMNCVDWYGARDYCAFAGGRLPTEAMWEKAARGGCDLHERLGFPCGQDPFAYPWGAEEPTCERTVFRPGGRPCGLEGTRPVGERPAGRSPYGVLDMAGNVWEWVADGPGPPEAGAEKRVVRGGGYFCESADHLRTTFRADAPAHRTSPDVGFRCAWDG